MIPGGGREVMRKVPTSIGMHQVATAQLQVVIPPWVDFRVVMGLFMRSTQKVRPGQR